MLDLSIVTPSYNYRPYISDCLDSVAHQSTPCREHLIIENGSTDGSFELISNHPAPKRLLQQEHTGLAVTLERLLAAAEGEWVGWQNADDFYLPTAFSSLANALKIHPDSDIFVGDTVFMAQNASVVRLLGAHRVSLPVALHYEMVPYAPCSYFFRRQMAVDVGVRLDTKFLMDKWLLADMLRAGAKASWAPTPLGVMRRHPDQVSATYAGDLGKEEREQFRRGVGIPHKGFGAAASIAYGRAVHVGLKVRDGAYRREFEWNRRRGFDCRWWTDADHWMRSL